jgi:hypothetical protein
VREKEAVRRWSTSSLRHVLCCKPSSHSRAPALPCPTLPRQAPSPRLDVPPKHGKKREALVRRASRASSAASALHRAGARGQKCRTTLTLRPL